LVATVNEMHVSITGDAAIQRMFLELPKTAQDRVLKPLIVQGSKIFDAAVKSAAPVESGLMKLAIGSSKLKTYGSTIFITTGVRRGFRRAVTASRQGKLRARSKSYTAANPSEVVRDPVKYLHLVTGGRKAITAVKSKLLYSAATNKFFGKSVAAAKPNPFVDRAFDAAKEQVAQTILSQAPPRIEAEAHKLAK
jgi:hypothetical protein